MSSIENYHRVLELEPGAVDASVNLAIHLAHSGDLDGAVHLIAVALRTNPDAQHTDLAWYNLGTFYEAKQQWEEAAAAYDEALKRNPNLMGASRHLSALEARFAPQKNQ